MLQNKYLEKRYYPINVNKLEQYKNAKDNYNVQHSKFTTNVQRKQLPKIVTSNRNLGKSKRL